MLHGSQCPPATPDHTPKPPASPLNFCLCPFMEACLAPYPGTSPIRCPCEAHHGIKEHGGKRAHGRGPSYQGSCAESGGDSPGWGASVSIRSLAAPENGGSSRDKRMEGGVFSPPTCPPRHAHTGREPTELTVAKLLPCATPPCPATRPDTCPHSPPTEPACH